MATKKRKTLTRKAISPQARARANRDQAVTQYTTRLLAMAEGSAAVTNATLDELRKIRKLLEIAIVRIGPRKARRPAR